MHILHNQTFSAQESSAIRFIEYNARTYTMLVEMRKGQCYTVSRVRYSDYVSIIEAYSIGKAWNAFRMTPGVIIEKA